MILDKISNMHCYTHTHPLFSKVFEYVEAYLQDPVAPGAYEISGKDLFVRVLEYETRDEGIFEVHDRYIDVQCMIEGAEKVYFTDREGMAPAGAYDPQEDTLLLQDREGCREVLFTAGEFAVFFPQDAHKPSISVGKKEKARKLVFKVRIQADL